MLLITCTGIGSLFAEAASSGMKAPANTLVQAKLVGEGYKVEIEAEAHLNE